jgi:hypothetical protein
MSTFSDQAQFIYKQLIYLVEVRKLTFSAAAFELRTTFCDEKPSTRLTSQAIEEGKSLKISRFELEIMAESGNMFKADQLLELKISIRDALRVVTTYNAENQYLVNSMIQFNSINNLKTIFRQYDGSQLESLNVERLKVLHYFIMQHQLTGQQALKILSGYTNDEAFNTASIIDIQLPSILRIAADIMRNTHMSFANALEQMVLMLQMQANPTENNLRTLQTYTYLQQVYAAKLLAQDFNILFPVSFASAQSLMDQYIAKVGNEPISDKHEIEIISLKYLEHLGWDAGQAQSIYNKLNAFQARDLEHAMRIAIPAYSNTAIYLLTMMNLDEAHAEIVRIVQNRFPFPKYKIAFDDNDYSQNIKDAGLEMWHIELLLSPKMIHRIYTAKFIEDNRLTVDKAERDIFKTANDKIISEHHKNRGKFYDRVIALAQDVLGHNSESAANFPYHFSEADFAEVPFLLEHIIPEILIDLTVHGMYQHNMTIDESINTIWKIVTHRFKYEKNPYFYNIASNLELEDWYLNYFTDKIRLEICTAAANLQPQITSTPTPNQQQQAGAKFANFLLPKYKSLRELRYQQSIDLLIEAGANTTTATALVKETLTAKQAHALSYNRQIKIPIIKDMIKAIYTIDRSLHSYGDAEAQMLKIMQGTFDHVGKRIPYENLISLYTIKPPHLLLITDAEKTKIIEEAAISVQQYDTLLGKNLINIDNVAVNRSHYLYPRRNDTLIVRPAPAPLYNYTQPRLELDYELSNSADYLTYRTAEINPSMWTLGGLTGALVFVATILGVLAARTPLRSLSLFNFGKRKPSSQVAETKTHPPMTRITINNISVDPSSDADKPLLGRGVKIVNASRPR